MLLRGLIATEELFIALLFTHRLNLSLFSQSKERKYLLTKHLNNETEFNNSINMQPLS